MAAPNAPCRLLQLPRELRNNIYEELNHDHFITITRDHDPNSKRRNGMAVDNAPYASVMRLCKQIHYEYDDVRFKKVHLIIYTAEMRLKLSTFDLKAGVPKELFKHVTWCQVSIPYGLLIDCDEDIVEEFNDAVAAGETMDETYRRAWTPSIGKLSSSHESTRTPSRSAPGPGVPESLGDRLALQSADFIQTLSKSSPA